MEVELIKQWQPGQVEINKITKGFPYLAATGLNSPPSHNKHTQPSAPTANNEPKPLLTLSLHWAHCIACRQALKQEHHNAKQDFDNAIWEAMLDSGAKSHFIQSADGLELTGKSSKTISTASGHVMHATRTDLLPLMQLKASARKALVVPELSTMALMSVKQLADQGYTTVFHPYLKGIMVHNNDSFRLVTTKLPLLQGWHDKRRL
jgi:hypothetical protein